MEFGRPATVLILTKASIRGIVRLRLVRIHTKFWIEDDTRCISFQSEKPLRDSCTLRLYQLDLAHSRRSLRAVVPQQDSEKVMALQNRTSNRLTAPFTGGKRSSHRKFAIVIPRSSHVDSSRSPLHGVAFGSLAVARCTPLISVMVWRLHLHG